MENVYNDKLEDEILSKIVRQYGNEIFTPGLDRTTKLYNELVISLKSRKVKIITIGGTNGKGQVAHTLSAFLTHINVNHVVWTSPHILSITERFKSSISGQSSNINYEQLKEIMIDCDLKIIKEFNDLKISFYEYLFYIFLNYANRIEKLEFIILEVGLGGRLDAVNHFQPDLTAITSISRDHQMILGNRYDEILHEKLGISRKNAILLTSFRLNYLNEICENYCQENGIVWQKLETKNLNYFEQNQNTAKAIFFHFFPGYQQKIDTFLKVIPNFKGRREEMTFNSNEFIFIGAHNTDGVREMIDLFAKDANFDQVICSFSKRPLDEIVTMSSSLISYFSKQRISIIWTTFNHPKALNDLELESALNSAYKKDKGLFDFIENWKYVISNSKKKRTLVCGSYYFIGEVQRFILSSH